MGGKIPAVPPHQTIELRLLDINGDPMRRADVSIAFGNDLFELKTTSDDGIVSFVLPLPHPPEGELTVTPRADKGLALTFKLFVARHEDAATLPGAQARLNNLGYLFLSGPPAQALADISDEPFERALARFKHANHLPTGGADTIEPAVKDRLVEAHDGTTGPLTR